MNHNQHTTQLNNLACIGKIIVVFLVKFQTNQLDILLIQMGPSEAVFEKNMLKSRNLFVAMWYACWIKTICLI